MPLFLLRGGPRALLSALGALALVACGGDPAPAEAPAPTAAPDRGPLLAARRCSGCHGGDLGGTRVGGWAPNLTPDEITGLGSWSPAAIGAAIREGIDRDGAPLCPTMPRFSPADLGDEDLASIVAHLRSLAPLDRPPLGACAP